MEDKHILGQNLVRKGLRSAPVSAQVLTRVGTDALEVESQS